MSHSFCSPQSEEQNAQQASPHGFGKSLWDQSESSRIMSLAPEAPTSGAMALQCGPGRPLAEAQATDLFGHYGDTQGGPSQTQVGAQTGQERSSYTILANPALHVAVPGTEVRYSVARDASHDTDGSHDSYQWMCQNDPNTSGALGMPEQVLGPQNTSSWNARWAFPGNHKIVCRVQRRSKESGFFSGYADRPPELVEYPQTVRSQGDVLARAIDHVPEKASADDQLRLLQAYQQALFTAEDQPGSGKLDPKTSGRALGWARHVGSRRAGDG